MKNDGTTPPFFCKKNKLPKAACVCVTFLFLIKLERKSHVNFDTKNSKNSLYEINDSFDVSNDCLHSSQISFHLFDSNIYHAYI